MVRINLIGASGRVKDVTAFLALRKLWKADKHAISTYAEHHWSLLEAGELDEVDWLCMLQDRTVRRRYDKRLRDALYRVKMPCDVCGTLILRPKWARHVSCGDACREEDSRLRNQKRVIEEQAALEQKARRPVVRIGTRSLKPLRSNTWHHGRTLSASTVMTRSETTPANVSGPAWKGHRVRVR